MSRGYTTSQDRSRRRMLTVIIVVGVVVAVGWIAAISALAGGGRGSQQGGAEGSASDSSGQAQSEEEQAAVEESAPETTAGAAGDSTAEPAPEPSVSDQGQSADAETGEAIAGQTQAQDVFDPMAEDQTRPTGGAASESGDASSQQEGSTAEEQPGPDGLTETEKTQARAASERYIAAAYGYSGGSADAYLQGIEQAASEEIYDSPGGSMLKGYSQAAPECGMKSTAILEEFEVIGQSPEGLDMAVTFSVEDADGQTHQFRQQQRLTSSGGGYAVSGVSVEELISETSPQQSCPGSESKDADSEDADGGENQPQVEPADLSAAESERARAAAERYITMAYGYTGDSGQEYRERIARTADEETIYSSPGGQRLEEYAKAAEDDGMKSAAVMESFEITSTDEDSVEGTAYFRVAESYDRYGELEGEGTPYKQDLTLTPVRSTYEVSRASVEQQISERQITVGHAKKTS